ncbi:MAG: DUF934 domain-containing protein [Parvularculaceae bacterium]
MLTLNLSGAAPRIERAAPRDEVGLDEAKAAGVAPGAALVLENDADVLDAPLDHVDAVILNFPSFTDGRAYGQARRLRARGFGGDIIARGSVLRDQAIFMSRCGFTVLELGGQNPEGFLEALSLYPAFYQSASDGSSALWASRHARGRDREAA